MSVTSSLSFSEQPPNAEPHFTFTQNGQEDMGLTSYEFAVLGRTSRKEAIQGAVYTPVKLNIPATSPT